MAQDLLLKQTGDSSFDLVLGEQDFETVDGLETAVAVLLFTDARAAPEEVNDPQLRRGWVGNILRSSELGGMLWLLVQAKNTQDIRNKINIWAESSLQPLIDDGSASQIIVTTDQDGVRGVKLFVNIIVKEGRSTKFDYWLDTNLGNLVNGNNST